MGTYIEYIKLITTTEPKTFRFELSKFAGSNLANENYSIIKHNQLLAEHTLKNEVQQLLLEYKHRNDIPEHRKQQNEWTT